MANDWAGTSLTEQGNAIINGPYGIKATSKLSTVFDESFDKRRTTAANLLAAIPSSE
ncbi:hypothetical protein D3C80_2100000 [compost metagenome]